MKERVSSKLGSLNYGTLMSVYLSHHWKTLITYRVWDLLEEDVSHVVIYCLFAKYLYLSVKVDFRSPEAYEASRDIISSGEGTIINAGGWPKRGEADRYLSNT